MSELEFDEHDGGDSFRYTAFTVHYLCENNGEGFVRGLSRVYCRRLRAPRRGAVESIEYEWRKYILDAARYFGVNKALIREDAYRVCARLGKLKESDMRGYAAVAVWLVARSRGYAISDDDVRGYLSSFNLKTRDIKYYAYRLLSANPHLNIDTKQLIWGFIARIAGELNIQDGRSLVKAYELAYKLSKFIPPQFAASSAAYIVFALKHNVNAASSRTYRESCYGFKFSKYVKELEVVVE